jgi:hypothetical protein
MLAAGLGAEVAEQLQLLVQQLQLCLVLLLAHQQIAQFLLLTPDAHDQLVIEVVRQRQEYVLESVLAEDRD